MNLATRARIAEHAEPASWYRLVARSPRLACAHARPEALVDWLDGSWPHAKPGSTALLRALQTPHWRVVLAADGDTDGGAPGFIVHTRLGLWRVRLQAGHTLVARSVERLSARETRIEP